MVKLKQAKQYLRDYYFIPDNAVCYQETDLMLGLKYLNDLADTSRDAAGRMHDVRLQHGRAHRHTALFLF